MEQIIRIVHGSDTREGRAFDWTIMGLIVISIATLSIATLPDLSDQTRRILSYVEIGIVAVFTVEYILRIATTDKKLKYVFSFHGIIDLAAILPFYLSAGVDLRALRIVRLFRVFRILKLAKYNSAIDRLYTALRSSKEEFVLFFSVTGVLLYVSAVGIYYFENAVQPEEFPSIIHSLWWAVITLTTVGYGDVYPVTAGGKMFTGLILMVGLGVVAVPTAIIASALSSARSQG